MKLFFLKLYLLILYITIASTILFASILLLKTDWLRVAFYQNKTKLENQEYLYIDSDSNNFESKILDVLSSSPELTLQRGIAGVPAISTIPFLDKLGLPVKYFGIDFVYSKNFENEVYKLLSIHNVKNFGGIILFDNNLTEFKSRDELRVWISGLIKKNTITLNLKFKDGKTFQAKIKPIIAMDCDLNYQGVSRYCRGLKYGLITQDVRSPLSDDAVSQMLSDVSDNGIDTLLAPSVDTNHGEYDLVSEYAVKISTQLHNEKIFPVLKHFAYKNSLLNTHNTSKLIKYSPIDFEREMQPYNMVERLGLPYGIMLTHHSLEMDPNVPLPVSEKVNKYVRQRFPHAIIISDEIKMRGLYNYESSMQEVITGLRSDMYIAHSGNIFFNLSEIILASKNIQKSEQKFYIERVLRFKEKIGLFKIEEVK